MRAILFATFFIATTTAAPKNAEIDWSQFKPIENQTLLKEKPTENEGIGKLVVNGIIPERHRFPFAAALISELIDGRELLCGASLISRWAVLTAAHCIYRATATVVVLGAFDLRNLNEDFQVRFRVTAANFQTHPLYRDGVTNSDIGVVRFDFAIAFFTPAVNIVQLPTDAQAAELFANVNAWVMGFGQDSDSPEFVPVLRAAEVLTMANPGVTGCTFRYPGLIDTSHICSNGPSGRQFCPGDEGSPLVVAVDGTYMQIGIASIFPNSGCMTGNPSVYTRITSFLSFIRQHM